MCTSIETRKCCRKQDLGGKRFLSVPKDSYILFISTINALGNSS